MKDHQYYPNSLTFERNYTSFSLNDSGHSYPLEIFSRINSVDLNGEFDMEDFLGGWCLPSSLLN